MDFQLEIEQWGIQRECLPGACAAALGSASPLAEGGRCHPQPPGLPARGAALRRRQAERCQGKATAAALLCQNKMMCVGVTLLLWREKDWE